MKKRTTSLHELTVKENFELVNGNKDGKRLSLRKLAEKFNISLDSVSNVLKCKAKYLNE
ncbi:unnamed protein product, partial [Didymodactylos carnosus]